MMLRNAPIDLFDKESLAEANAAVERERAVAASPRAIEGRRTNFASAAARLVANQKLEQQAKADRAAAHAAVKLAAKRAAAKPAEQDDEPTVREAPAISLPPPPRGSMVPTKWQAEVLAIPAGWSILLAGGRGGGKTTAAEMLALRHCEQFGDRARALVVRETLKSLIEFEDLLQAVLSSIYLRGLKINRQEHTFRLPNGAVIECAPLSDQSDYEKVQGRSFSAIFIEELGNFRTLKWVDLLRSNLRAGDLPTRIIASANPGGRAHQHIVARFISKSAPWTRFDIDGRPWIIAPSTLLDNPYLPQSYEQDLFAATGRDKELFRAWRDGSWSISRGAAFSDVIDESKQMLSGDCGLVLPGDGLFGFIASDWGLSSPACAYAAVRVLREQPRFPKGSLVLVDEVSSHDPHDESFSSGLQWSPTRFGDHIAAMCDRTGVRREGCVDDSRGLTESLIQILAKPPLHLHLSPPQKKRREGWSQLRELLFNSKEANGRAGMWISDRCAAWWATVPSLPRDPLHPEDVDSSGPDHWADASRYACTYEPRIFTYGKTFGT
jgi:hypothetical protein